MVIILKELIFKGTKPVRLDIYLNEQYPLIRPSVLNKFLRQNKVKVNGTKTSAGQKLIKGDIIALYVNDEYLLLIRPCDRGHTPYGDIFLSHSKDLTYWGKHRWVMSPVKIWENTKIGAGPTPIETDEGWLCFYHGVLTSCNGFTYSMGAMIVDRDEPWKVLHRADRYLLSPRETYEFVGDVPNVVFPCAALADADSGKIAIYYGGADTVVALAFTTVDEVVDYIKANDLMNK